VVAALAVSTVLAMVNGVAGVMGTELGVLSAGVMGHRARELAELAMVEADESGEKVGDIVRTRARSSAAGRDFPVTKGRCTGCVLDLTSCLMVEPKPSHGAEDSGAVACRSGSSP